jgi:CHAD domain-containing protein
MSPQLVHKVTPISPVIAFRERLEKQIQQLVGGLGDLQSTNSPENIHQIRILTRRARAACKVLHACYSTSQLGSLEKNLRKVTRVLGPIRSLDVSCRELKSASQQKEQAGGESIKFLHQALKKYRKKYKARWDALRSVTKMGKKIKRVTLIDYWEHLDQSHFVEVLELASNEAVKKLKAAWVRFKESSEMKDLHRTRIDLKRWRYLEEIRGHCIEGSGEAHLLKIKGLQDRLGHIHDVEVLRGHLKEKAVRRRFRTEKEKELYRDFLAELKSSLQEGLKTFHREGEDLLRSLVGEAVA